MWLQIHRPPNAQTAPQTPVYGLRCSCPRTGKMCNNTVFQCYNLTEEKCRAHSLAAGISDVIIATVCFSLVVCVLGRWKKDAWNSQVKRASLALSFFLALSSLNFAPAALYNGFLPSGYCEVVVFVYAYTKFTIFLYMVAMLGMLLIKIASPVISRNCTCNPQSHSALFEVVTHVFISLSSLIFTAGEVLSGNTICYNGDCATNKFYVDGIFVIIFVMSLVVLFILCSVFFLIYLYVRFFRKVSITKKMKWQMFKFSILLMLLVIVLAFEISFYWVLEETNPNLLIGHFTINSSFLEFIFIVTVMAMLYLPSSRCCKKNKSDSHRPLLSNIHPTNPPSVWNHRNTPSSTTVFNPPPEMSDCMSQNAE